MCWLSVALVEVERVAVEVSEHVILEHFLVTVQRELLAAHGADFPVALHMLLELALVIVGREDDLAQWASLHVHAARMVRGQKRREKDKEREGRGENAHVNKQWSDDVGKPGAQANKEHLSDATWVACCSTNANKRGLCSRTNTLHMLQCTGFENRRVQQTLMAFMRVRVCGLCFTWDQSRRQFVHHSQMGCGFQLLRAVRWYYPERER